MKKFGNILIIKTILITCSLAVPLIQPQHSNYPEGRLSLLDWQGYSHREPEGPGSYAFGYDIEEPENDNVQFRHEERHSNGTVTGSYGFVTPDGNVHIINYIADHLGYRANTETRYRGSGKPVKVNEEQDIQDAISAVKNVKPVYTNRYQDYRTHLNDANGEEDPNVNLLDNEDPNLNPNLILEKYKIFGDQQQRINRNIFFLQKNNLLENI